MERLIVFDLDGTLCDSRAAIVGCVRAAFQALGLPTPPPEAIAARIGLPLTAMFAQLAPGAPADELTVAYRARYREFDARYTRTFPGVPELIRELPGALAIATSKSTAGAERALRTAGLRERFSVVLGHDSVARGKPAPDMLNEALRRAGFPPERAVMVGDTTFDLEMADAAGVPALGVAWGVHGTERLARWRVVETVPELAAALAG